MIQIDMKMPKVCDVCPFMDDNHGDYPWCIALQQNRGYNFPIIEKRFPNCPLKPVEDKKEDSETNKLKHICRVLFNRCKVVGSAGGAMCVFCGIRKECEEMSGGIEKEAEY